eukprot:TRINITY_DN3112_c0_g2_i1.p1 TRINITY_DN3112_c0_g2~~TRINITY_DN3112_c0_g2_i1.p1  ORF type:complete len:506 (-),score=137.96 TRINITY_DN3112_c0_g2_i1:267-1784(-)
MGNKASTTTPDENDEESDAESEDVLAGLGEDSDGEETQAKPRVEPGAKKLVPQPAKGKAPNGVSKNKIALPTMTPFAAAAAAKAAKAKAKAKNGEALEQSRAFNARIEAERRREEEAASGKPRSHPNTEASTSLPPQEAPLPRGDIGSVWECLEDCIVREGRDVKSTRLGGLQAGERCEQTGPWRADASGRVRMPMQGPRGLVGWVTIDERRCQNALDKTYGNLLFSVAAVLASCEDSEPEDAEAENQSKPQAAYDPLLDYLVETHDRSAAEPQRDSEANGSSLATEAAIAGLSVRAYKRLLAEAKKANHPLSASEEASPGAQSWGSLGSASGEMSEVSMASVQAVVAEPGEVIDACSQAAIAAAVQGQVQLTEAQKRLRNLYKKLREAEALHDRISEDSRDSATAEQRQKLAKMPELQQQILAAEEEVRDKVKACGETPVAATNAKRKKKAGGAAADKKKNKTAQGALRLAEEEGMSSKSIAVAVAIIATVLGAYYASSWANTI